jgi:hypothetical protein
MPETSIQAVAARSAQCDVLCIGPFFWSCISVPVSIVPDLLILKVVGTSATSAALSCAPVDGVAVAAGELAAVDGDAAVVDRLFVDELFAGELDQPATSAATTGARHARRARFRMCEVHPRKGSPQETEARSGARFNQTPESDMKSRCGHPGFRQGGFPVGERMRGVAIARR